MQSAAVLTKTAVESPGLHVSQLAAASFAKDFVQALGMEGPPIYQVPTSTCIFVASGFLL